MYTRDSLLVKEEKLTICRTTFYKYAKQIEPQRKRINKYKKKRPALRAKRINELWHFDISHYRTLDGEKYYIYAIIDNYSRKILEWKVESKIRNKYVSEMLLLALGVDKPGALKIMSDGGSENIGKHVKLILQKYFITCGAEVKHMIALKDIEYSNNMIERFFNIMKSDYLYPSEIEDGEMLYKKVSDLMHEYNFIRPHYTHKLLTPHEVYSGKQQPDLRERFSKARDERIYKNKNCSCTLCTCNNSDESPK